jgi:hypothetical protein
MVLSPVPLVVIVQALFKPTRLPQSIQAQLQESADFNSVVFDQGFWEHESVPVNRRRLRILAVLQAQMRHADVRTTLKVYAHVIPQSQCNSMERIANRSIGTNVPNGTNSIA